MRRFALHAFLLLSGGNKLLAANDFRQPQYHRVCAGAAVIDSIPCVLTVAPFPGQVNWNFGDPGKPGY